MLYHYGKRHLWWILTLLGLITILVLIRGRLMPKQIEASTLSQPTAMASVAPLGIETSPTNYEPLVTSNKEQFKQLETSSTINYMPLSKPILKGFTEVIPTEPTESVSDETNSHKETSTLLADTAIDGHKILALHTVKSGEILASIALRYDVTTEAIRNVNHLAVSDPIRVGQKLIIPKNPTIKTKYLHQIKEHETLLGIAAKYRSSIDDILAANLALDPDNLQPGEIITVPVIFSLEPTPEATSAVITQYHVVEPGESPLQIANWYDISVEMLLAINEITDPHKLRIGTKLSIPQTDGISLGVPIMLHEIKSGETILGIVSRYGSSVRDVLYSNPDLQPSTLEAGQLVAIPIIFPSKRTQPISNKPSPPKTPPPDFPQLAEEMVALLNVERATHNLPNLEMDKGLTEVARGHAQDMVMRQYFGHVSPDGRTLRQRLIDHGFASNLKAGENIQMNSQSAENTVEIAVQWLMNSPPHRKNILHQQYNKVGIGIVKERGVYTIVMDFSE